MKNVIITLSALVCVCLAATIPAPKTTAATKTATADGTSRFDVTALLPSGAATGATGDNAVSAVADDESGAVGAKGQNAVLGMSAPGMATGLGTNLQGFNTLFGGGSQNDPAATPPANNFFNFFN